jgi:RpiR family carbohydrate utilization transcriptional regulator
MEKNSLPHGAKASIRHYYNSLSPTEKLVADYVLANAEMVVYQPLEKVAEAAHVSDATVLRFARSVGFSGFPELKMGLLVDFVAPVKSISLEIDSEDDGGIILQKVFEQNSQTLQEIIPLIEEETFQDAVNLLASARNIYLFAIGTSVPLIFSFHNLLIRLGLKVSLITDPYTQILQAAVLDEKDLVVIISRSGVPLTHPILYRAAKRSGAQILCITTDPKKPYAKYTEHILLVPSSESINVSPPTSPVLMVVFEALYTALLLRFRQQAIEYQNRISEALMETLVEDKNI